MNNKQRRGVSLRAACLQAAVRGNHSSIEDPDAGGPGTVGTVGTPDMKKDIYRRHLPTGDPTYGEIS